MSDDDENHLIAERRAKLAQAARARHRLPERLSPRCAGRAISLTRLRREERPRCSRPTAIARAASPAGCAPSASWARRASPSSRIRAARSRCFCSAARSARSTTNSRAWDVGDVIGAEGVLFRTKTGELSVRAERSALLTKSLRPLPDKWHGIADTEMRYRRRYVDLIMNEESRRVFETRTRDRALPARVPRFARLPRSRDADAASDSRRCRGASLQDPSQRARRRTCICASRPSCI